MYIIPNGKPLVIDLFAGSFGWSAGFIAEGWQSIGVDIAHEPYHGPVPEHCSLLIQDVLTLHGSQFKDAAIIVASPPCQEFSCTGLPFKQFVGLIPKTDLFDACFRIQREAIEAAGRHIPLIVENVVSAQKWVGRAKWKYSGIAPDRPHTAS